MSQASSALPPTVDALRRTLLARYPLVYLVSPEEERAERMLRAAADQVLPTPYEVWTWSATSGLTGASGKAEPGTAELLGALDRAAELAGPAVFLLRDPHGYVGDSRVTRRLRELYHQLRGTPRVAVMVSPLFRVPLELRKELAVVDVPPPSLAELEPILEEALTEAKGAGRLPRPLEADERNGLLRALQGLTLHEARHALGKVYGDRPFDISGLAAVLEEKARLTRKEGILEFVPRTVRIDDVGGLETLKDWLLKRRRLFRDRSESASELAPKGLLMMGVSGCGKSLSIKAISHFWDLPLFRLDLTQVFSGAFGTPEDAFARGLKLSEAMAPCILWLDEIEGGITGYEQGAGGSTWRIFSTFLTWMQEKQAAVFVAATANRIDLLPAEIIRKGRFDQIFFVDLPSEQERAEIFKVHLRNRNANMEEFDLGILAKGTRNWNGAEIEQCVLSALVEAYALGRPLTKEDIYDQMQRLVPLATTMSEQIKAIRSWAHDRALKAGK